jgi:hypothetical protein
VLVSKQVQNDNVLAIAGVQMTQECKLCIVSEWMEHGNMHTYLKNKEDADRAELVSPRPIHNTPYLNPLGIAAWRDKGSRLLTLH